MGRFSIQDDEDYDAGENDSEPHLSLALQSPEENCHGNPFQDLPHFRNAEHQNENRIPNEVNTSDSLYPIQLRSFRNNEWTHRDVPVERRRWSRHIFVICILIVFQKYLPPPPPPNDTWHDYISNSTESIMSVAVNALALTYYITFGCFINIRSDVILHIQHWKQRYKQDGMIQILNNMKNSRKDHGSYCSFQSMDLHTIEKYLFKRIVGQHSSIHIIAEAVSRPWQSSNKPLSILLTGPTGVGKYKTLKLLSHMMLGGNETWSSSTIDDVPCWIDSSPSCQHVILELNGFDYALDNEDGHSNIHNHGNGQKNSMVDRILHHIHQQQGNGAVILIKHVEQLSESHRLDLIRIVQSPMVKFQKKDESSMIRKYEQILGFPETFHFEDIELSLQNSIFLLTTDVGTKRIFDVIREGSNHIDDIQNRIRQDIKQDLGSYFHTVDYVIPYCPLQFSHMKSALEMEIKNMNCTFQREMGHGIQITEQALHILVSPSIVEYIEVPYTLSSSITKNVDSSFVFAAHGGHGLAVKGIQNLIVKVMRNVSFQGPNEFVRIDVRSDDYILILERCRVNEMSDGNEEFCFDRWEFHINDLMIPKM
jgi:DNA polymerase III delta prime subunit